MDISSRNLGKTATTRGASMGEARLAGLPGKGTLQVWRGQKQDVLEICGTFRPESGATDAEELKRTLARSKPLIFDGPIDDPAATGAERKRAEVQVSSINSYRMGDDTPALFVNFVPVEPERVAS